jgi:hypothetical protein
MLFFFYPLFIRLSTIRVFFLMRPTTTIHQKILLMSLSKKKRENKRTVTLSFFSWRYSIRNLPNSQREAQKTSVVISLASECALPCGSIIIPAEIL